MPEKSESDSESSTDDSLIDVNFNAKQTKTRKSIASKVKSNNATASAPENNVAENLQHDKRVFKRATKGQVSSRYSPTLYMFAILFTIALVLSAIGESPVLPLASSQTERTPIFDGHTLWHPWERAILLIGYQLLIASYKVLPPKTSAGKYLCGGSYNETEVSAPSWYMEWEHEIESVTKRSLKLSEINTTKSINLHSRRRRTVESVSSVYITQKYVTNKVPIISLKEVNSLVKFNNFTIDEPLLSTI